MTEAEPETEAGKRAYAPRMRRGDRREQLLDTTLKLINESGYDGLTIAKIARAAGVTRPVVYNSFPTLEDLMDALLERQASRVFTQVASNLSGAGLDTDPMELWAYNLGNFLRAVAEDPETWRMVLMPPPSTPPDLLRRMQEARRQVVFALQGLIKWGLEKRGIYDGDVEMHTLLSVELFEQSARLMLSDPERYPPSRIEKFTRGFFAFTTSPPATD
jgi:AcrR family transcriptional regulator